MNLYKVIDLIVRYMGVGMCVHVCEWDSVIFVHNKLNSFDFYHNNCLQKLNKRYNRNRFLSKYKQFEISFCLHRNTKRFITITYINIDLTVTLLSF